MNTIFIENIKDKLHFTLNEVNIWFEKPNEVLYYKNQNDDWSVAQTLEHIVLTNHFLLIIIEKGVKKSLKKAEAKDWEKEFEDYIFDESKLDLIGISKSFEWIRPEHMEPQLNGEQDLKVVKAKIYQQMAQCVTYLEQLSKGEGVLLKTTMSVNNLGKIDVYEYIYFLAQHAARHIMQMKRNEQTFLNKV